MNHRVTLSVRYLAVLLLVLSSEPLRCGVPTVEIFAAEIPPAIMITKGKTAQAFAWEGAV